VSELIRNDYLMNITEMLIRDEHNTLKTNRTDVFGKVEQRRTKV